MPRYRLHVDLEPGDEFRYVYDFGDRWSHRIRVEKIEPGSLDAHLLQAPARGRADREGLGDGPRADEEEEG